MQAPVGKFNINDSITPTIKHITDNTADKATIPLKLFVNFLAIIAGKTIKLEMSKVPINLIPKTTTKAVIREIKN